MTSEVLVENNIYDKRHKQKYITFLCGIIVVAIATVLVFFFVIGVSRVDGESMLPTLKNEETLFFSRVDKNYNRGDVVAIDMPNGDYYVKRIIGVAGDEIDIHDGKVYLNGDALDESYYTQGNTMTDSELVSFPLTVSEGKYFVLGDNREHSTDSREIGEVSAYAILGKIWGQY